jgi:DNA-binding GntR family transcriptional regulator
MKLAARMKERPAPPRIMELSERLARDILAGTFGLEGWLKQSELEQRYDCTRMEVRRALDHLTLRRLVRHEPNRGYRVFRPDARQVTELLARMSHTDE